MRNLVQLEWIKNDQRRTEAGCHANQIGKAFPLNSGTTMITIQKCILSLIMIAGLGGCATTTSDNIVGYTMVDPGKYETYVYTCQQLSDALKAQKARELALQKLMAKASESPGGEFVGLIAYRADYLQARAEQEMVIKVQKEKKC
jgi:hypothetical protein